MPEKNTDPTRPDGEQGDVASLKKDHGVVAEARLQGTASSTWSLFARRHYIVRWSRSLGVPAPYGILPSPVFEALARLLRNTEQEEGEKTEELPQGRSIDRLW